MTYMPSTLRHVATLLALLAVAMVGAAATARDAQTTWQLTVCAAGDDLPYSNRQEQGFENSIMSLVAADLHAEISYIWLPSIQVPRENLKLLNEGRCDVLLDVGDTSEDFLTTLAYFQTTYYFVQRADAPFTIESFDDESLTQLRVGVVIASPPDEALGERGLAGNVVHYSPTQLSDPEEAMVDDVASGVTDLAVVFGPLAGKLAQAHPGLELTPVAPQVDVSGLSMVYQTTMGVRRDDTDLRDLLNQALAGSWHDVQSALEEANVPVLPLPEPVLSVDGQAEVRELRIGVIVPTTGDTTLGTLAGEPLLGVAANRSAAMAGGQLFGTPGPEGVPFRVLISSAPDAASAERAARRMIAGEGAYAVVGGFSTAEARVLAGVAEELEAVFLNVGAPSDSLRGEACSRNTFHLAPSARMYVDAMLESGTAAGAHRWFLLGSDGAEQAANLESAQALLRTKEGTAVTASVVRAGESVYSTAIDALEEARPDLVLLFLTPDEELTFLGQYEGSGLAAPILAYPSPAAQTRQFYGAYVQNVRGSDSPRLLAAWDATLDTGSASEFNLRFLSRNGLAADPAAWAAYVGTRLLAEAAIQAGSVDGPTLIAYLEHGDEDLDVGKGPGTTFRSWDHQMRQPLYAVRVNRDYQDRASLRDLASVEAVLPLGQGVVNADRLDLLGVDQAESGCSLAGEH